MVNNFKKQEYSDGLRDVISKWITRNSNAQSLITIQAVELAETNKSVKVYISVLPESEGAKAIDFLTRHAHDIGTFLKKEMRHRMVPFLKFEKTRSSTFETVVTRDIE